MDRVETLLQKLQQQFSDGASAGQLLMTVRMLQSELAHLQQNESAEIASQYIAVSMPVEVLSNNTDEDAAEIETPVIAEVKPPVEEEKIIEVLQVDEAEIEAELEEIKRNAAAMQKIGSQSKPQLLFDPVEDDDIPPTLAHQNSYKKPEPAKEVNESVAEVAASLNDRLKENQADLSEKLIDTPIKDLKKAIGINDRFLFINELFRGDEAMYERSIKTINSFSIFPEAEYWIRRELKVKLGWQDSNETVKQFDHLVKRRFS